jgi:OsmC-like protein
MSRTVGGGATAPTPGWLLRAALASCDATAIAMDAARELVELTDLTVTVESESDFRGVLGVDDSVDPVQAQSGCASSSRGPPPLRGNCAR